MTGPATVDPGSREHLSDDAFLDGRLNCLQPARGFRSGLDAVLLAATIPARTGDEVLDTGCGAGIAGLCLAARVPGIRLTGIDLAPELVELATRNAARNDLASKVRFVQGDITAPFASLEDTGVAPNAFAHVLANPPYFDDGTARPPRDPIEARANLMPPDALAAWARFWATVTRSGGTLCVIHRAAALPNLLEVLDSRFGDLVILPIHSRDGEPAHRIIVQAIKGSRAPLSIRPGLIIHERDSSAFRPAITAILRDAAPLAIRPEEALN